MNALAQATFDLRPFIGGDNPRNNIERKNLLRSGLIAIHVESDTHPKQSLLGRLLIPAEFLIAYGGDALKQQAGARSRCSVGTEHLIVKTAGLVSVKKHEKSVRSPEARGRPRPSTLLYCADYKSNPVFRQGCTFYGVWILARRRRAGILARRTGFLRTPECIRNQGRVFLQGYAKNAYSLAKLLASPHGALRVC